MSEPITLDEVAALPKPPADHRIAYGDDPFQFGELRLPAGSGPFPVVVFVHGGCWLSKYDLGHAASLSGALTAEGVAVWTPEYRRVGNTGGGWPGTLEDAARAIEHVRTIAASHPLNLGRVVLMGHSAGGHLALWYAAKNKLPPSSRLYSRDPLPLKGVVALAAIGDLVKFRHDDTRECNEAVAGLLGGEPEDVAERVAEASPVELLPLNVPVRLIHGALDESVKLSQSVDFEARASAGSDEVELFVVDGAGHFDPIAPGTAAWTIAVEQTRALLAG